MNFYIPDEIIVGYQKRGDTLTEHLAFITYRKPDGKLLNESNFNKWISKDIPHVVLKNSPSNDFVVNKNVRHGNHYSSDTKIRIYDTREMEIEIPVDNFLFVVKNSEILKGNIKQDCVYGWLNNQIYLVPINSNEYKEAMQHTNAVNEKVSEYFVGNVYQDKKQNDYLYLGTGKLSYFDEDRYYTENIDEILYKTKKGHIFIDTRGNISVSVTEKYNSSTTPWETIEDCKQIFKNLQEFNEVLSKSKKNLKVLKQPLNSIFDQYVNILKKLDEDDINWFSPSNDNYYNFSIFSNNTAYSFETFGNAYRGEEVKIGLFSEKNVKRHKRYDTFREQVSVKEEGNENWFKNKIKEIMKNNELFINVIKIDDIVLPINLVKKLSGFYTTHKDYSMVLDVVNLMREKK